MKGNIVIFEDNAYKGRFTATDFFNLTKNNGTPTYQQDVAFQVLIDGNIVKIGKLKAYIDFGDAYTSNEVMDVGCLKGPFFEESTVPIEMEIFKVGDAVSAKDNFMAEFRSSGVPVCVARGDIFTITSFRRNECQAVLQSPKYKGDILALVSNLRIFIKREFI